MEQRIENTAGGVKQNMQDIEGLRQELRRMQSKLEEEREARDAALCEELRDRDKSNYTWTSRASAECE
jgi:hypothetical protein